MTWRAPLVLAWLAACGGVERDAQVVRVPSARFAATVDGVQSFRLWVLGAADVTGKPVSCAELVTRVRRPDDAEVIKLSEPFAGGGETSADLDDIPAGELRTFYVDLYDQPNALGVRVGVGCVESVEVIAGKSIDVRIELGPAPKSAI